MSYSKNCYRVYVGNLPPDTTNKNIEDLFGGFGKILNVELKNNRRQGPSFAFVEFEDPRDAEDSVTRRDGYNYEGCRLRVEFPRVGNRGRDGSQSRDRHSSSRSYGGRGYGRGPLRLKGTPPRRSLHRVIVTGLPLTGSWQDLKDHMREAGDVLFADTYKDGTGVVDFLRLEDMEYAIKALDDTRFCSHRGEVSYIRVKGDEDSPRGNGVRSDRSRSRSNSYSPRRRRGSNSKSPHGRRGSNSKSPCERRDSNSKSPRERRESYSKSRRRRHGYNSKSRRERRLVSNSKSPRERRGSNSKSRRERSYSNSK